MCCVDCLQYLANGEISEDRPNIAEEIRAQWPDADLDLVIGGGDHDEEFSKQECDACGSRLAGSRHEFAVLEPEPVMSQEVQLTLMNLLDWAIGNRGNKEDNPYSVPEVKAALALLAKAQMRNGWQEAVTNPKGIHPLGNKETT